MMPLSMAEWCLTSGCLEMLSKYTPMKMIKKPHRSDTLSLPLVVLKPLKRIADAIMVDVEKKT